MTTDDLINQQLGQYAIKSVLGRGGMATVYLARQASMDRDIAIKVMAPDLTEDEQFVARFEHEAQLIARLQHPHILPVIDFGREGKYVYIVMHLVRGGSLDERLQIGALPLNVARRMLDQISSALTFAHEQGIIHRDLKPNNVLLDERDNAYLTDFGIAKMLAGTSKLTATGNILGTPAYMAPEQWRGEPVDARTDTYSLGVMLYEMVLGRLPFSGETPYTLMYKHFNDAPPPPRTINPNIQPAIEAVLLRALAKEPDERYQAADAMAADFTTAIHSLPKAGPVEPLDATLIGDEAGPALSETPTMMPSPVTPVQTPVPHPLAAPAPAPRSLPVWWIGLAVVIVLAALAGGAFMLLGGKDDDATGTPVALVPTATDTITPEPSLTPTERPTDTPSPVPTERVALARVLVDRVNVRRGPGLEYEVLGSLGRDEEAIVNGVSLDGDWYQIVYGTQLGWVSAETVRTSGNPNIPPVAWPTATPEPTATHTPEPPTATHTLAPTATHTPEPPTATHTPEPPTATFTLEPTPAEVLVTDPAIFLPAEFREITLPGGIMLDYPANWREPTYFGVVASLFPFLVDDPAYDLHPTVVIARGSPDRLVGGGTIDRTSSAVEALEFTYGANFSGLSQPDDSFIYPAHKLDVRETTMHAWAWMIEISSTDWLHIIALAPAGSYDQQFGDEVLWNRMLTSLHVDGQALVKGTETGPAVVEAPVQLGTVVLDRFDDNQNDWRFATLSNNRLVLDTPNLDYLGWSFPNALGQSGTAYYVQATGQTVRQPNYYEYGLIFRFNSQSDFYYLVVNHRQEFVLYRAGGGSLAELAGPTVSTLVDAGPQATNTLGVLVLGDYIEVYVNGQLVGSAVDSTLRGGDVRVAAYTFADSNGTVSVAYDDFVFLPLVVTSDPDLAATGSALIGTVLPGQAAIQVAPDMLSDTLITLTQGQVAALFGRSTDRRFVYGYARGAVGWIDATRVQIARDGSPVDLGTLPALDPAVRGLRVEAWPVIWPDTDVTLAYGQTVTGTLDAAGVASWTFYGTAGDVISLAANADPNTTLDPFLTLLGPDSSSLIVDDDEGPGLNALIAGFTLPLNGVYTVEVLGVSGSGGYSLTLSRDN